MLSNTTGHAHTKRHVTTLKKVQSFDIHHSHYHLFRSHMHSHANMIHFRMHLTSDQVSNMAREKIGNEKRVVEMDVKMSNKTKRKKQAASSCEQQSKAAGVVVALFCSEWV